MLRHPVLRGIFRTDARARAAYSEGAGIYRIIPQAVALPADAGDIKALIVWAAEHRVPVIPRGAGSGMGGGNVGDGVLVDLTRVTRKLQVRPAERTAATSTAVTLTELNTVAARDSLRLPPDPSSARWATLGGMVSTNAAGARSVRYGSVRRWVRGLTLITAEGEQATLRRGRLSPGDTSAAALARFHRDVAPRLRSAASLISQRYPPTRKNSSGYALDAYLESGDVLDLIIGAEGTLGIVSEIEWLLDSIPPARTGMRIRLPSLDHLSDVVSALNRFEPSALELLDGSFLDLLGADALERSGLGSWPEAILLLEFEGDQPSVLRHVLSDAAAAVEPWGVSVEAAYSPSDAERLWAIRHAASPMLAALPEDRRSLQVIEDACVPLELMGEYIGTVRRLAARRGLQIAMFGHAGDGHIHVNLLPELARADWQAQVAGLLEDVTAVVVRLGGTPSGEHGDGRLRAGTVLDVYGSGIVELFGEVKRAFDPLGIFNPGIILPSGEPPISRLKVGPQAAPIPADLQSALREIELTGGYGRCRLELADEERSRV